MNRHQTGYAILVAALGMVLGLLAPEVSALSSWSAVSTPAFIGKAMAHVAVVVAAFVGGKIIPTSKDTP